MAIQPLHPMTTALKALLEQQRALDQREIREAGEHFRTPGEREMNLQAIDHLERAMACVAADDPRDALVQLLVATGHAHALAQDTCELALADELLFVSRLLRSALPVLAKSVDFDLEAFGANHYGLREQSEAPPPKTEVEPPPEAGRPPRADGEPSGPETSGSS